MRTILDRETRAIQKQVNSSNSRQSVSMLPTPKGVSKLDRKRIQDDLKMQIYEKTTKATNEHSKTASNDTQSLLEKTQKAQHTAKKDIQTQNEKMQ